MFWRSMSTFGQPSVIDTLLDRSGVSLELLLDEDDLQQEVRAPNARLLEFLRRPECAEALLRYACLPLAPATPDAAAAALRRSKYPQAACEVLCADAESLLLAVASSPALLRLLMTAPEAWPAGRGSPRHVPSGVPPAAGGGPALAIRWSRIVSSLLLRCGRELIGWLEGNRGLLEALVPRLGLTPVAEALVQLVGADEASSASMPPHALAWVAHTSLLPSLLALLASDDPPTQQHENAAEVLGAIARARAPAR
ncbi:hypothetical protein WJX81_002843 [Elliptochloris bilobata]|uniref:Uncharacterized protein n=1 Tax=Elliptochloris bilobata TaxID=381761 RepID=A0AAW1RG66_9CHLO